MEVAPTVPAGNVALANVRARRRWRSAGNAGWCGLNCRPDARSRQADASPAPLSGCTLLHGGLPGDEAPGTLLEQNFFQPMARPRSCCPRNPDAPPPPSLRHFGCGDCWGQKAGFTWTVNGVATTDGLYCLNKSKWSPADRRRRQDKQGGVWPKQATDIQRENADSCKV